MPRVDACTHSRICGLDALPGEQLCILHSREPNKDLGAFRRAVRTRLDGKDLRFDLVHFPKEWTEFALETLPEDVSFRGAEFGGDVNFSGTVFKGKAVFSEAVFRGEANFSRASFEKDADFGHAHFNDAHFYDTVFVETATFTRTTFDGTANFAMARFEKSACFDEAVFQGRAYYYHCTFEQGASFDTALFRSLAVFAGTEKRDLFQNGYMTSFVSVLFEIPARVYFDHADLSHSTFTRTDLRGVRLRRINWARIGRRLVLYDEVLAASVNRKDEFALVEELYTSLKQHWEQEKNYEIAGHFHFGEKEMRRRSRPFVRDPVLWFYWAFSGYGEDADRAFRWLVALWLGFGICFLAFESKAPTFLGAVAESLTRSLRAMTLRAPADSTLLESLAGILGPIQVALFVLAVRRRMNR
jgi:uncharacterized protein YjbI with pentapeptide repeats